MFLFQFYEEIRTYEKTECPDERKKLAKSIYDNFIMKEMLSHTHVSFELELKVPSLNILFCLFEGIFQRMCGSRQQLFAEE